MMEKVFYRRVAGIASFVLFSVLPAGAAVGVQGVAGTSVSAPVAETPASADTAGQALAANAPVAASDVLSNTGKTMEEKGETAALQEEDTSAAYGKLLSLEAISTTDAAEVLPENVAKVMNKKVFGLSLFELSYSFIILLLTLLLRNIITHIFFNWLKRLAERSRFNLNQKMIHALEKPVSVFLLFFGIYIALMILSLSDGLKGFITDAYRGLTVIIIVWGLIRIVDVLVDRMVSKNPARFNAMQGFAPLIRKTLKIFIGVVGVMIAIDNMGFNIGGILATLGIGGAALAFASKDTIANGFGTLMIMLDRPFKVGDWIIVGDKVDGDVEEIGLRSTKVRTWPKTILSIPNGVLANEYINNWSRMPKRRVKQIISIAHGATANDMEGIVEDIRAQLRGDDGVDQDFMLVNFTDVTSDSLDILVYYFTKSIKWLEHMDVRQRINLKMMRAIEERGLKIAFIQQSVELEYNRNATDTEKMPWDERWDAEPRRNPNGTYTPRRPAEKPDAGTASTATDSKLPGDLGPKYPL